jgi:hypothetical protein
MDGPFQGDLWTMGSLYPVVALNSVLGFNKPLTIKDQPLNQGNHWITQIVTFEKYHKSSGNRLFMVVCS